MFFLPAELVKEGRIEALTHNGELNGGLGMSQDIRCHIRSCDSVFGFLPYEATASPPSQPHASLSVSL